MSKFKFFGVLVAALVLTGVGFAAPMSVQAQTTDVDLLATLLNLTPDQKATLSSLLGGSSVGGAMTSGSMTMPAFTRDLSEGSTGTDVMNLQKFLNMKGYAVATTGPGSAGQESTYFGSLTKAALARYQAAVGISPAAGFFGPTTRAHVNAQLGAVTGGGSTGGTMGGSTTLCPNGMTLASNCTLAPGQTQQQLCPNGKTLISNCTLMPGETGTGNNPSVTGGAGDITVTERSLGTTDEVLEGEEEAKVLGFDVEATGSDISITSVRVEFEHEGSGSDRLNRYVDEVFVFFGDEMVGSADVDEFSESSDVYSRNIPVSGVVIGEDETERFYVAVSAVNNIDSNDVSENWEVALGQIRFVDGTGAILTDNTGTGVLAGSGITTAIGDSFTFEDLSSGGDVDLRVSEDDSDVNEPHSVPVDDSSDTNDVNILSFTLDADGSDIFLDTLSFGITSTGAGVTEIANDFRLLMGGDEVGTARIDVGVTGDTNTYTGGTGGSFASSTDLARVVTIIDLDDDDVVIREGSRVDFMLVADINDIDGAFSSGDKLSVALSGDTTTDSNGHIVADDENGDALTNDELSGTADSTDIEFLSTGISVKTVSVNAVVENQGTDSLTDDKGVFTIVFDVTAIEDTAFIETGTVEHDTTGAEGENNSAANVVFQDSPNSYAATSTGSIALADLTRESGGSVSGNFIQIGAGQTARFKLRVEFEPGHVTGSSVGYRMYLRSVNYAATAVDATAQQVLTPEIDYRTGAISIPN